MTILTKCSHCFTYLLANQHSEGKQVKCTKCGQSFTCTDLWSFDWVKKVDASEKECSVNKKASKVLFTFGVSIPINHIRNYCEHFENPLKIGDSGQATILIDGKSYCVKTRHFLDRNGYEKMNFNWSENDEISRVLRRKMSHAYRHFVINGERDFLQNESVTLSLSENVGEFVLTIETSSKEEEGLDTSSSGQTDNFADLLAILRGGD